MNKSASESNTTTVVPKLSESAQSFRTPEQRLGVLAGSLASRASEWGWLPIYERWRRGEPVTAFQRKFLSVSAHYRARGRERDYDSKTIAAIRPLPERAR